MNSQRIQARDMRAALRKAKERYGDNVVILANRPIPNGIELLVSTERPTISPNANEDFAHQSRRKGETLAQRFGVELPQPPSQQRNAPTQAATARSEMAELKSELAELKAMLMQNQTPTPVATPEATKPVTRKINPVVAALQGEGFSARAQAQLNFKDDHKDPLRRGLNAVLRSMQTLPEPGLHDSTQIFVGAAGAGKTTTLAKLAAQAVLKGGADSVAIISLDSRRLGAGLIANSLARVLGVKVLTCTPDESLLEKRAGLSATQVFVDTAGLAPSDSGYRRQQAQIAELADARVWWVSAATSQIGAARSVYQSLQNLQVSGLILTKLDEAYSLGEGLSLALETNLPMAWTTDGQRIPDDIQTANANSLISQTLLLARQHSTSAVNKAVS